MSPRENQDHMMDNTKYPPDQCLSERSGHLYIEDCDTVELIKEFGSPLFVVSEQQLRDNYRQYKRAFSQFWPNGQVDILPANKANWNTAVRTILSQEGAGADIYSEGELHSALDAKSGET